MSISQTRTRGIWRRSHYLDRMTLDSLTVAFFQHHVDWAYLILGAGTVGFTVSRPPSRLRIAAAVLAAGLLYSLNWYVMGRWVLHGRWMFKSPLTAGVWKRSCYDHHFDPNHGITNFAGDDLFGTLCERDSRPPKSPTVFNLAYTQEAAERYPWVAARSGGPARDRPRRVRP